MLVVLINVPPQEREYLVCTANQWVGLVFLVLI